MTSKENLESRLKAFFEWALIRGYEHGEVEDCGIEDKALELGLIELRPIKEEDSPDGETEHYFPVWFPRESK